MKKKIFEILIICLTMYCLYFIINEKLVVYNSIIYSLKLWVNSLIPALFPFFIISDILINYNIIYYVPFRFKKSIKKIFNITDNMLTILLLSMISGFPSNARNTRTLYDAKAISVDEANHILIFSHFANPLFILTTVAVFFFNDKKMGIILLFVHYLSNIILGLLCRNKFIHINKNINNITSKKNFGDIFISAISRSIDTILLICGIITIFLLLSTIVVESLNLNIYNSSLIKGIMEITIGIESLSKINISAIYKAAITSFFLAFGGLSVHMQVISQITGTKIKYFYFFIGRIYQAIIAVILTIIIYLI